MIYILDNTTFCESNSIKQLFSFIGQIFNFAKIIIPILIILLGIIDLIKSMTSSTNDSNKNLILFAKRLIFGVAIFFIFPIINFLMNLLGTNLDNQCMKCFSNPTDKSICSFSKKHISKIEIESPNLNMDKCKNAVDKNKCCSDELGNNDSDGIWIWNDDVGCKNTTPANPE